jgi:hypothetical protein
MPKGKTKIPRRGEIDEINEKVSKITGMSIKDLYRGDGVHPSTRSLQMNLDAFTKMQRENDTHVDTKLVVCSSCSHVHEQEVPRRIYSISQQMAMSEAWSHELRYKIQEAEAKKSVQIRVDPYFEDWE